MKSEFEQGYACALASIVYAHGASTEVREALVAAGLTSEEKMRNFGVDEYDINILRPVLDEIELNRAYLKRKQK